MLPFPAFFETGFGICNKMIASGSAIYQAVSLLTAFSHFD